jgi:glycosyltransferase involved in cell wall biosynthesis
MTARDGAEARPRFSIVIPAHNEADRIGKTLRDVAGAFSDSEIIVVLNGCTDGTRGVVEALRGQNLVVLDIAEDTGKGGAVRAGFSIARAETVGYMDADGSTSAAEMRRLCETLGTYDGVIASRWLPESKIAIRQPWHRRIASRCFNLAVRSLFGLPFKDTQCGAKVFRASAWREVAREAATAGLAFDVDLLVTMNRLKMRVREEPTTWNNMPGSRLKLASASVQMLASVVKLRLVYPFRSPSRKRDDARLTKGAS